LPAWENSHGRKTRSKRTSVHGARGGRVRLHMDTDMAEILRERISAALNKTIGP
jgi:hypothetical protein